MYLGVFDNCANDNKIEKPTTTFILELSTELHNISYTIANNSNIIRTYVILDKKRSRKSSDEQKLVSSIASYYVKNVKNTYLRHHLYLLYCEWNS